jgi:hypothetical protein
MSYRFRSKEEREIEEAVQSTIMYANFAGHLQGPHSKPGEAVKAMPEETRELLRKVKPEHLQDTYMTRQFPNE